MSARNILFRRQLLETPLSAEDLLAGVVLEPIGPGRRTATLVREPTLDRVPLVRTTTTCRLPSQAMRAVHEGLSPANTALLEVYDRRYTRMGWHSDQALDLAPGSSITIVSCYQRPERLAHPRVLRIRSKTDDEKSWNICLDHNSVVTFSLETNSRFSHQIVLPDPDQEDPDQEMVCLTFRQSKTFISFRENKGPHFSDSDRPFRLANKTEQKAFYQHRYLENRSVGGFQWPETDFTVSPGDLLCPEGLR